MDDSLAVHHDLRLDAAAGPRRSTTLPGCSGLSAGVGDTHSSPTITAAAVLSMFFLIVCCTPSVGSGTAESLQSLQGRMGLFCQEGAGRLGQGLQSSPGFRRADAFEDAGSANRGSTSLPVATSRSRQFSRGDIPDLQVFGGVDRESSQCLAVGREGDGFQGTVGPQRSSPRRATAPGGSGSP